MKKNPGEEAIFGHGKKRDWSLFFSRYILRVSTFCTVPFYFFYGESLVGKCRKCQAGLAVIAHTLRAESDTTPLNACSAKLVIVCFFWVIREAQIWSVGKCILSSLTIPARRVWGGISVLPAFMYVFSLHLCCTFPCTYSFLTSYPTVPWGQMQ